MQRIAIIGAGVSGMSAARFLADRYSVTVYEKEARPGGLIKCRRVADSLFHTCGGHVFNSKRQDVLDWFWSLFDKDTAFTKADRRSVVYTADGRLIPYPIENHVYLFDADTQKAIVRDLLALTAAPPAEPKNFEQFLRQRFGDTLYRLYFKPYNEKVWRRSLKSVPLSWLEGKLPMPTIEEIIFNNMNHVEEKQFVHASFWYEKCGGSQYLADKMAEGLDIRYGTEVNEILRTGNQWRILGELYDKVIFCGNIKQMVEVVKGVPADMCREQVSQLEYHGTTAVFCEIDRNPYSWIYQPSTAHESHRIICTGNFSPTNNASSLPNDRITATVEFTDNPSADTIRDSMSRMPFAPKYLDRQYNEYTYPIQDAHTRDMIQQLKARLRPYDFYFTGRFADWEYYNMDVAIGASMDLCKTL